MDFSEKADRTDRTSLIRQQTSRIYMTTIAANEREDRLLNKKLDALDLEHRSQFLQMKKWIHYTKQCNERRFPELNPSEAVNQRGYRHSIASVSPLRCESIKGKTIRFESHPDTRDNARMPDLPRKSLEPLSNIASVAQKTNPGAFLGDNQSSNNKQNVEKLHNRIRYTENEVVRLRKSYAGQKSPPVRKRTFLPHLENAPEISPEENQSNDGNQRIALFKKKVWQRREKTLPSMHFNSKKEAPLRIEPSLSLEKKREVQFGGRKMAKIKSDVSSGLSRSLPNF